MTHRKALAKLFTQASSRHSTWDVFTDFLAMSAIAISNAVDMQHRDDREAEYMRLIGKYDRKDIDLFPQMLGELTMAMEDEPCDILGQIHGELGLANKWVGQFFTPDNVALMMAKIVAGDMAKQIKEKGFVTVGEPTIGGGAMIINLALALRDAGINYQQTICVTGWDIDIKSIHMSYLHLSLLHVPAVLIHGDSLALKEWSHWYTPAYILGGWAWKRQREQEKSRKAILIPKPGTGKQKYEAISLFEVG